MISGQSWVFKGMVTTNKVGWLHTYELRMSLERVEATFAFRLCQISAGFDATCLHSFQNLCCNEIMFVDIMRLILAIQRDTITLICDMLACFSYPCLSCYILDYCNILFLSRLSCVEVLMGHLWHWLSSWRKGGLVS